MPAGEKVWFALAAYNAGFGHVEDAMRLADELGLDPLQWFDNVERAMTLLSNPRYARHTRFGYCRGRRPAMFVREIRKRYKAYVRLAP